MKSKLAIFDMDGTLFDTTEVNFKSYKNACKEYGYDIEETKFKESFIGKNYKDFLPILGIDSTENLEKIHTFKKIDYKNHLNLAKKNDSLFELIKSIKKDYVVAIATTASKENTYNILEHFDVLNLFDIIITQENCEKLKPNPECYTQVMNLAKISANNTIIFEDSEVGISAGKASGATVFVVEM